MDYPRNISARSAITTLVVGLVTVFVVLIFGCSAVTKVDTGKVGVLTLFGRVTGEQLPSGLHLINPFKSSNEMLIQTQEVKEVAEVPSSEGLTIHLETSVLFHLDGAGAPDVYRDQGTSYVANIVEPTLRSAIREATASHAASALYSADREKVASEITTALITQLQPRHVIVEKVLLRDIQLPATLKASIEAKQQADQEQQAMSFRLQKERQEAERKRIEAQGIHDFQQTVSQGISPALLQWKGIEATEALARSPNTKIVVIGNSKNGLPLILGGAEQ